MCKISVIIPVYNSNQYIEECISSFLKQTFEDFELIIIDDGSVDNSVAKIKAIRDTRIKLFCQENGGPSKARNTGIDNCKGEYIVFADSDDVVSNTYLEKMYTAIKDADADIAICSYLYLKNGKHIDSGKYTKRQYLITEEKIKYLQMGVFTKKYYVKGINSSRYMHGTVWGKIFDRNIILDNCLKFNEDIRLGMGEDNLFTLYSYEYAKRILWIDEPLVFYRVGINSVRYIKTDFSWRIKQCKNYIMDIDTFINNSCYTTEFEKFKNINRANVLLEISSRYVLDAAKKTSIEKLNKLRNDEVFLILFEEKNEYLNFAKRIFISMFKRKKWNSVMTLSRMYTRRML